MEVFYNKNENRFLELLNKKTKMKILSIVFILIISVGKASAENQKINIADYLKLKCNVGPEINFPGEFNGETAQLFIALTPMRLIGISDVTEAFTIAASIFMSWTDECTTNALESEDLKHLNMSTFYFEKGTFWSPKLIHLNSKVFKTTKSDDFEQSARLYRGGVHGKDAIYSTYIYGVFESHCDLDLHTFPFDRFELFDLFRS